MHAPTLAEPYTLIIAWNGAAWTFQFNWGNNFFLFFGAGAWVAGTKSWDYTSTIFGPGVGCIGNATIKWTPRAWCSEQIIRRNPASLAPDYYDERLSAGGDVLQWLQPSVPLVGARTWQSQGAGLVWAPDHVRGLTFKSGSQVGPRALGQSIWWEY